MLYRILRERELIPHSGGLARPLDPQARLRRRSRNQPDAGAVAVEAELYDGMSPNVYIIAGPNGAGKTTFAREFLPNYADCKNFINADLIAEAMAPFSPETAALRAGRTMLGEIRSFARRRVSFAFETTLSGRSYLTLP